MKLEIDLPASVAYSYRMKTMLKYPGLKTDEEVKSKLAELIIMDLRRIEWM